MGRPRPPASSSFPVFPFQSLPSSPAISSLLHRIFKIPVTTTEDARPTFDRTLGAETRPNHNRPQVPARGWACSFFCGLPSSPPGRIDDFTRQLCNCRRAMCHFKFFFFFRRLFSLRSFLCWNLAGSVRPVPPARRRVFSKDRQAKLNYQLCTSEVLVSSLPFYGIYRTSFEPFMQSVCARVFSDQAASHIREPHPLFSKS